MSSTKHAGSPYDPPRVIQVTIDENTEDVEILKSIAKPHRQLFKCNAAKSFASAANGPRPTWLTGRV
jgi:hypothetical protein